MFFLNEIEVLADDLQSLTDGMQHKLSFKAVFVIKGVPDTFTGTVIENAQGDLQVLHFNHPKGNKRKVITLKNKLVPGGFELIKQALFACLRDEPSGLPVQIDIVQRRRSGTPRAETQTKTSE